MFRFFIRIFVIILILAKSVVLGGVEEAEYFFDADPGYGNGTTLLFAEDDSVTIIEEISVSGLSVGLHLLNVRFKDVDGAWGHTTARPIIVSEVDIQSSQDLINGEYYFDVDPGHGSGTSLSIIEGDSISLLEDISFSELSIGRHTFNVRFQTENSLWSHITARPVIISRYNTIDKPNLLRGEYFFDSDPGFGNGLSISLSAEDTISSYFDLSIDTLCLGEHSLFVRFQNEDDSWGFVQYDTMNVIPDDIPPEITVLLPNEDYTIPEYTELTTTWLAQDNAQVDSIQIYYSNNGGDTYSLYGQLLADTSQYSFIVPEGVTDEARLKLIAIDVHGLESTAYSAFFSITDNTSPIISYFSIPDSTIFGIGSRMDIMVSATDNVQVTGLDLNYTIDAGATWVPIVQGLYPVAGRPTYSWLIPDIPGDCQIQAIVTDAVALTDTSYSDMFSVIVEYPVLEASLLQIRPSMDMLLHFSQGMETGVSTGIQVIGTIGGVYEVEGTASGQDVSISAVNGFVSLDTLMLVLSASEWTNVFGYGLDGNGDGIYDGSPIDNDTSYTFVSAAGDYDQNSILNFDDFNTFVLAWNNSATDYELAPHLGEIPFINIQPDSSFDIFDLATFASMWNWSAGVFQTSPQISNYDVVSMDATQNGNLLSVNLETTGFIASQTIIKYDPNIVSVSVSDPGLGKVSTESMVLVDANPDSGYITITSSQLSGTIEDQLSLELTPKTKQRYSIEVAVQGSGEDANVTQKRTSIELIPIPTTYSLSQNYPNPFNASTMIEYGLPAKSELNISIFDIRGRFVKEIHSGPQQAGYHAVQWSGLNEYGVGVASGVYFIVLHTSEYRMAKKALILK